MMSCVMPCTSATPVASTAADATQQPTKEQQLLLRESTTNMALMFEAMSDELLETAANNGEPMELSRDEHRGAVVAAVATIAAAPAPAAGKLLDQTPPADADTVVTTQPATNIYEGDYKLTDALIADIRSRPVNFGFNGLGEMVFLRTYSRLKPDDTKESYHDCVERVIRGTFQMQLEHHRRLHGHATFEDLIMLNNYAARMGPRILDMMFTPPGRGLWAMGTSIVQEKRLYAALNNCAFVSTRDIEKDPAKPFVFLMDASMLGVGTGFDLKGADKVRVYQPSSTRLCTYVVPDSREGWVESVRDQLESYLLPPTASLCNWMEGELVHADTPHLVFDYSLIRPAGEQLKCFGGTSSGHDVLKQLHERIDVILSRAAARDSSVMSAKDILDIMNSIGVCVVAGNVRRTAEIAFGEATCEEYMDAKDYKKHPERADIGWASNNSIIAEVGMDYRPVARRILYNGMGEPGLFWLKNARQYGRMGRERDFKDIYVLGGNPCLEQSLEPYELCCLVETMLNRHACGMNLRDPAQMRQALHEFKDTLELAHMYAKTVTLGEVHWPESREVMMRNRRIGVSLTGVQQFVAEHGLHALRTFCELGYEHLVQCDVRLSHLWQVPQSIKLTSIKPSGTVSLLSGSTPGMHWPIAECYERRMRLSADNSLLPLLRSKGYIIEDAEVKRIVVPPLIHNDELTELTLRVRSENPYANVRMNNSITHLIVYDPRSKVVVFPVDAGVGVRSQSQVSPSEQVSMAIVLQHYWADNQVSVTVSFDADKTTVEDIVSLLEMAEDNLKGLSMMPMAHNYPQPPYTPITRQQYNECLREQQERAAAYVAENHSTPPMAALQHEDGHGAMYCDGDACEMQRATLSSSSIDAFN